MTNESVDRKRLYYVGNLSIFMFGELIRRPLFWACMFLTAAAELAPGQWVNISLSNVVGMQDTLLLAYVSALMFASCLAAAVGLYLRSLAGSPVQFDRGSFAVNRDFIRRNAHVPR